MNDSLALIAQAVDRLRAGRLVAFPTETVFGLGADALNPAAVQRVFDLKGRPANNPLIVHVSGSAMARPLVSRWTDHAEALARAFWPGPLTLVLPKSDLVPPIVTANGPNVALRCPDHPLALALLFEFSMPIVGPSANRSGFVSPTKAAHVRDEFPGQDLLILEGGDAAGRVGIESTVLSLAGATPAILRPGAVTPQQIASVLRLTPIVQPPRVAGGASEPPSPLDSPGLLERHYAPRTPAHLLALSDLPAILSLHAGRPAVLLARNELPPGLDLSRVDLLRMPSDPESYAAALYAALRDADRRAPDRILIESVPAPEQAANDHDRALWSAIADRLARATTPI